jgi:hypothetical protein
MKSGTDDTTTQGVAKLRIGNLMVLRRGVCCPQQAFDRVLNISHDYEYITKCEPEARDRAKNSRGHLPETEHPIWDPKRPRAERTPGSARSKSQRRRASASGWSRPTTRRELHVRRVAPVRGRLPAISSRRCGQHALRGGCSAPLTSCGSRTPSFAASSPRSRSRPPAQSRRSRCRPGRCCARKPAPRVW